MIQWLKIGKIKFLEQEKKNGAYKVAWLQNDLPARCFTLPKKRTSIIFVEYHLKKIKNTTFLSLTAQLKLIFFKKCKPNV